MRKRTMLRIASIFGIILFVVIGYYGYSIIKFGNDIQKTPETSRFKDFYNRPPNIGPVYEPPKWEGKERVNILLLGGDTRGLDAHEAPRSDTMMIVSIDPQTKKAAILSVLRDTYTAIPGHQNNRINAALALGGPDLSMKAVSELVGLPIQYYVYVDFEGFIQLIDAIGGIEYEVEKDMKYTDITDKQEYNIDLKKGLQHLDGNKALQYVRFRHDALSDFNRTERQRNFLKAVADKLQSTSSLIKLPGTLEKVSPYIETNMSLNTMLRLGTLAFTVDMQNVTDLQIPPDELVRDERIQGAAVLTADEDKLRQYVKQQLEEKLEENTEDGTAGESGEPSDRSS